MQDTFNPPAEPAEPSVETISIQDLAAPLYQAKGWIKLVGVLMIISGILLCLTCAGIIIAWLPIWMGIVLVGAASAVEKAYNEQQSNAMVEALTKLKTYFTIMGIVTLIGIILNVISIIFVFMSGALAAVAGAAASGTPQ